MPISERFKIVFNIKGNCDVFLDADIESPFMIDFTLILYQNRV